MKKLVYVALVITLIISVSGCISTIPKKKREVIEREAIAYMEDKYNEEFTFVSSNIKWDAIYIKILVESKRFPGQPIRINRSLKTEAMTDAYMELYMQDKIEKLVNQWVPSVYPKSITFHYANESPHETPQPDMSVEEFMTYESDHNHLDLKIYVEDPDYKNNEEEDIESLRLLFEEKGLKADFVIYYLKEGKLKSLDFENRTKEIDGRRERGWLLHRLNADMDVDYSYRYITIRDSKWW